MGDAVVISVLLNKVVKVNPNHLPQLAGCKWKCTQGANGAGLCKLLE